MIEAQNSNRDASYDVLRFVAIALVVIYHFVKHFDVTWGAPYLRNFIIGMNMPVFFLLSGFFLAKSINGGSRFLAHMRSYYLPIFWVTCLVTAPSLIKSIPAGLGSWTIKFFNVYTDCFWFLWCLAICYSLTFLAARWRFGLFVLMVAYLILFCFEDVWILLHIKAMMPYFLLGVYVFRNFRVWENNLVGGSCLAVFLLVVLLEGDIMSNGLNFYRATNTWGGFFKDGFCALRYSAILAIGTVGSVGVMWLIRNAVKSYPSMNILASLGTTTLGVYISHEWLLNRIPVGRFPAWFNVFLTLAIYVFCHLLTLYSMRVPWFRKYVWGKS